MFKHFMYEHKNSKFEDFWHITISKFEEVYPNLCTLATVFLTWPQSSVNVERGFSRQNLVKTDLRNSLTVQNMDRILMIKLEGPATITSVDWDEMLENCCMKSRRILSEKTVDKLCNKS